MKSPTVLFSTHELRQQGQSPWLDYISRDLLRTGKLKALMEQGVLGVTSNPSIFNVAISKPGSIYEKDIQKLIRAGANTFEIYDALTISDIQETCDLFLPVFEESKGGHGFVSLEVLPGLAHEEEETVQEAHRLFKAVNRPNVMIKVPATQEGIAAVRRLIGDGINVNVTLMFSVSHYQDVANAYMTGLEILKEKGGDLSRVHSVASLFVSRVDTLVDKILNERAESEKDPGRKTEIRGLLGKTAVSNCKIIYQEFKKVIQSKRFRDLQADGARVQKALWGSTSTKNPNYHDLLYVEPLVGKETVNTLPMPTLEALLDHGKITGHTVEEGVGDAEIHLQRIRELGLDLNAICEELQRDGVKAFMDAFDSLMGTIETLRLKTKTPKNKIFSRTGYSLGEAASKIDASFVSQLEKDRFLERFFKKDPTLWKDQPEHRAVINNRLGWLRVAEWMIAKLYELDQLQEEVIREGIRDVVLLGMGGSSLAAEVMDLMLKKTTKRAPRFHVMDTTDAQSIMQLERDVDLNATVFIVSSKSGSTVETLSQMQYFYKRVSRAHKRKGSSFQGDVGLHFIAITDSGSKLEQFAVEKKFRRVFLNPADIGGRYSALSYFGMVPAALVGLSFHEMIASAIGLLKATEEGSNLRENAAIYLGIMLGQLAKTGRDKLTFWMSKSLEPFGSWLEQLIAESTGKEGLGILPVEGEAMDDPDRYGSDRVFCVMTRKGDPVADLKSKVRKMKKAGFPVIEIEWPDVACLGAEFLRWEIVTSVASAVLGVNPFDEPNVKESKDITARILSKRKSEKLSDDRPAGFFKKMREGSYLALLAYLERSAENAKALERIRKILRRHFKAPVLVGFGPRYLHSIGQYYKGGPKQGLFIEFASQFGKEIPVPGAPYGFDELKHAQASGDKEALKQKGLPVWSVDLGKNPRTGFQRFEKELSKLLQE